MSLTPLTETERINYFDTDPLFLAAEADAEAINEGEQPTMSAEDITALASHPAFPYHQNVIYLFTEHPNTPGPVLSTLVDALVEQLNVGSCPDFPGIEAMAEQDRASRFGRPGEPSLVFYAFTFAVSHRNFPRESFHKALQVVGGVEFLTSRVDVPAEMLDDLLDAADRDVRILKDQQNVSLPGSTARNEYMLPVNLLVVTRRMPLTEPQARRVIDLAMSIRAVDDLSPLLADAVNTLLLSEVSTYHQYLTQQELSMLIVEAASS